MAIESTGHLFRAQEAVAAGRNLIRELIDDGTLRISVTVKDGSDEEVTLCVSCRFQVAEVRDSYIDNENTVRLAARRLLDRMFWELKNPGGESC